MVSWHRSQRIGKASASVAEPIGAILVATILCGIVLLATGHDPVFAYGQLIQRTLLRPLGLQETIVRAGPILIAGVAVLVAVKAGLWNIGIDGQVLMGALAAGYVGAHLASVPGPLLWACCAGVGAFAGGLWALVPALLRARWGLNEIVTSIMFNYVAFSLGAWLVKGPIRDRSLVTPQTVMIPRDVRLTSIGDTRLHLGIIAAVALALVLYLVLRHTVAGFELTFVGANVRAARHGLIPVTSYLIGAFITSGAIAALAGVNDVLSTKGTFQAEWNPGYGLAAFALVFLARRNPLGLIPAALFLGFLAYGADIMPRAADIAPAFFELFEGMLLIVLALSTWIHVRVARNATLVGDAS